MVRVAYLSSSESSNLTPLSCDLMKGKIILQNPSEQDPDCMAGVQEDRILGVRFMNYDMLNVAKWTFLNL